MAAITPISFHGHFDDVQQLWTLKISRALQEPQGNKPYQQQKYTETDLGTIVVDIYRYYGASPTSDGDTLVAADLGDMRDLTTILGSLTLPTLTAPAASTPSDDYPGADPDLDPDVTDWGVTEP